MPIIEELNNLYDINWLIIGFGDNSRGMYSKEYVENFITRNSIDAEILKQKYRFSSPLILIFYYSICKIIKKSKQSLVYTSYLGEPFFLIMLSFFFNRRNVVVAYHDVVLHSGESHAKLKQIYHSIIRKVYFNFHLFSINQKNIFVKKHKNKNILVAPLAVKDFGGVSRIIESKQVRFLFFGTIIKYKGLDILLKAINYLVEVLGQTNFVLTIAGFADNKEWTNYETLINHPEQLICDIRVIPNFEVPDLFSNNDFLILPYREATQSGPLMIAYNYGLPVIASDIASFKEVLIETETGLFFQNNNFLDLALKMNDCIINQRNNTYSKEGVKIVANKFYNPNVISKFYSNYFNSL